MLTEYYVGLDEAHLEGFVDYFTEMEEVSLFDEDHVSLYYYSLMFFKYIDEAYGTDTILDIVYSDENDIYAIEDATGVDFDVLFREFALSVALSGRGAVDCPYKTTALGINAEIIDALYSIEEFPPLSFEDIYSSDSILPYSLILNLWESIPDKFYFESTGIEGNYAIVTPVL